MEESSFRNKGEGTIKYNVPYLDKDEKQTVETVFGGGLEPVTSDEKAVKIGGGEPEPKPEPEPEPEDCDHFGTLREAKEIEGGGGYADYYCSKCGTLLGRVTSTMDEDGTVLVRFQEMPKKERTIVKKGKAFEKKYNLNYYYSNRRYLLGIGRKFKGSRNREPLKTLNRRDKI